MRTQEERNAAARWLAEQHAKFYKAEAQKDPDYQWLADKWKQIVESLQ